MNIETLAPYLVGLFGLCGSFMALLGVGVGALISYLNNRQNIHAQAEQRIEERDEQRREAKIQAKEKWIEHDILEVIDSTSNLINMLSKYNFLRIKLERINKEIKFQG